MDGQPENEASLRRFLGLIWKYLYVGGKSVSSLNECLAFSATAGSLNQFLPAFCLGGGLPTNDAYSPQVSKTGFKV